MIENIEPRDDFYSKDINLERMESVLNYVISTLNLAEILKMIREISYDMVAYYNGETCSKIYKDDSYSEQNRWEANQLQSLLRTTCDLFGQSILDKREFGNYLDHWLNGGAMENQISDLKNEIECLKDQIQEWKNRCYDLEEELKELR
jgi:hypothetical protein